MSVGVLVVLLTLLPPKKELKVSFTRELERVDLLVFGVTKIEQRLSRLLLSKKSAASVSKKRNDRRFELEEM